MCIFLWQVLGSCLLSVCCQQLRGSRLMSQMVPWSSAYALKVMLANSVSHVALVTTGKSHMEDHLPPAYHATATTILTIVTLTQVKMCYDY